MKIPNLNECVECVAVGFVSLILLISVALYSYNAFAAGKGDPHHQIPEPVINIIEINNYAQIVDYDRLDSLGNALNSMSALSSIPSLNRSMGGTTGVGVGFGGYDGQGAAIVLEHYVGNMSYRAGVGHSGGEEIVNFGVMGSW